MTKALFGSLVALALVVGLAFRLARLDARPMHHDEANQAVKFGALLETGDYRYDASDHHGPTLYYVTLPVAWLRGQRTLAALDETTVRLVPAVFGIGLILLVLPLARGLGRPAAAIAAALAAVSPALTYYSRFYIQEMSFACFSLGFLIAAGRYLTDSRSGILHSTFNIPHSARRPGPLPALWAGLWAGLAMTTKETWLITLPVAVIAVVVANWQSWSFAPHLQDETGPGAKLTTGRGARAMTGCGAKLQLCVQAGVALFVALAIACVFYSSFFTNPSGIGEWIRSFPIYGSRGLGGGAHDEPWWYYLHILAFSRSGGVVFTEALVLLLATAGTVFAFAGRIRLKPDAAFWPRAVALYAIIVGLVFSAIPYKTPWNLVPFYAAIVIVAGYGAARLVSIVRRPLLRAACLIVLAAGTCHLGLEAWRADVRYAADPRNPYVYAQTTTDFLRLADRVTDLSAVHGDGRGTLVKVLAGPYEQWPLPWYLRKMTRVGYWSRAAEAGTLDEAPILVASEDNTAIVDAALGDRYVSEYYGLRPGVLLTLYVERGLWERYLAVQQVGSSK